MFNGYHNVGSSVELLQFEMSVFSDVAQLELAKEKLSEEVANIRKDKVMSKAVALVLCTQLCITHLPLQAGSRYVIFAQSNMEQSFHTSLFISRAYHNCSFVNLLLEKKVYPKFLHCFVTSDNFF